jgi:hypothetical protein
MTGIREISEVPFDDEVTGTRDVRTNPTSRLFAQHINDTIPLDEVFMNHATAEQFEHVRASVHERSVRGTEITEERVKVAP